MKWINRGGPGLKARMDKQKKPYQGQGYMRKVMELAGTRSLGRGGTLYDLIRYPAKKASDPAKQ